jgi:hypothetical protein
MVFEDALGYIKVNFLLRTHIFVGSEEGGEVGAKGDGWVYEKS